LMDEDGSIKAISEASRFVRNAVWSPDDKLIAYQSDLTGIPQIYVYEVETGLTRRVTGDPETVNTVPSFAPTWHCDSSAQVVFTSLFETQADVFSAPTRPLTADPINVEQEANNLTQDSQHYDGFPQGVASTQANLARLLNTLVDWSS